MRPAPAPRLKRRTLLALALAPGAVGAAPPALVAAAEAGDTATLRRLLDGGTRVDTRD